MKTIKRFNEDGNLEEYLLKEDVLKLIDEWFSKRLINVNWEELKQKINGK